MDYITLSKILPLLIYPFSVALWLMIAALILLWFHKVRWAAGSLGLAIAVLMVGGNPTLAGALYARHERTFLPVPVDEYPVVDAIVALGGALSPPLPPRLHFDLGGGTDRLLHAVRLYRAGKAPLLVLSGGNVFPQPGVRGESFYAAELVEQWGVPRSAILFEDKSRNTYQNAVFTKRLLDELALNRILLVTSAMHMPRALATFESAGLEVIPAPTDYNMVEHNQPAAFDWIPSLGALNGTTALIYEQLGILAYRYRGWIKP